MRNGPVIAPVAALIGDPARANMLTALMDGRALTVSELAQTAGVTLQTASGHLAKLDTAGLVVAERQGRHRYFRLSGPDVAQALEVLMGIAQRTGAVRIRTGPSDQALREARVCYDHLAGERGVALMQSLTRQEFLSQDADPLITVSGQKFFSTLGLDIGTLTRGRRRLCRRCMDWSERRAHLGGALGAQLFDLLIARQWARRAEGRVVVFTTTGLQAFSETFGLH
jgi:DNA-binding transcriptional ArsR family regulator